MLRCAVNPVIGQEDRFYHPAPTNQRRTVLTAGGGPAGCQAALEAHQRGHRVILCEASDRLGGLKYADNADFKANIAKYRDWIAGQVMALPIEVRLNTEVTRTVVEQVKPDVLIVAIGAKPWDAPGAPGRGRAGDFWRGPAQGYPRGRAGGGSRAAA